MPATISKRSIVGDELLHSAAIDPELREEMIANPAAFGLPEDAELVLPSSVERQDSSFLQLLNEGLEVTDIVMCSSSCSFSILTAICDGTTK